MSVRSPRLEKALRLRLKQRLAKSGLTRKSRQSLRYKRLTTPAGVPIVFFGAMFALLLFAKAPHLRPMMDLTALVLTVAGLAWEGVLSNTLYAHNVLRVFWQYPATEREVFAFQWRKACRLALLLACLMGTLAAIICLCRSTPAIAAAALVWGFAQAAVLLATGCLLSAYLPSFRRANLFFILAALFGLGCAFAPPAWVHALTGNLGYWVELATPAGWVNYVFEHGVVRGDWMSFTLLAPIAVFLASLPYARRRMEKQYLPFLLPEEILARFPQPVPRQPAAPEETSAPDQPTAPVPPPVPLPDPMTTKTHVKDLLQLTSFEQIGPIEKLVWRWLNPWERAVAEFILMQLPSWTANLWLAVKLTAVGLGLAWMLRANQSLAGTILLFTGVLSAVIGSPALGGFWLAFRPCWCGSGVVPFYATFPIGFKEVTPVFLKVNLVRAAFFLPLAVAIGWVVAVVWNYPELTGAMSGLKAGLAMVLIQPALLGYRFAAPASAGGASVEKVFFFIVQLFLLLALLVMVSLFVVLSSWSGSGLAGFFTVVFSLLIYGHLRWAYGRTRIDLQTIPSQGTNLFRPPA